jgi:hypothetical protein
MKKFKYQRYDYSILSSYVKNINDYINIPKDYVIKNIEYKDGIIYISFYTSINEITFQLNANDLISDEA